MLEHNTPVSSATTNADWMLTGNLGVWFGFGFGFGFGGFFGGDLVHIVSSFFFYTYRRTLRRGQAACSKAGRCTSCRSCAAKSTSLSTLLLAFWTIIWTISH